MRRRAGSRSRRSGGRARPRRRRGRCRPRGTPRRRASRAASCPTSPSPITPTVSPSCASAWRTPCSAIAPTVAYAASSNETPSGMRRDEVPRHGEDLGVVRALAAAGDAVAGRDALDPLADLEHDPGGRVADRRERLEPVARRVERGADPLDARLVHDLLDEVGAGARLLEQVLLARDDLRPLGAGADQRNAVRDEQPAGPERGGGTSTTLTAPSLGRWATCFIVAKRMRSREDIVDGDVNQIARVPIPRRRPYDPFMSGRPPRRLRYEIRVHVEGAARL